MIRATLRQIQTFEAVARLKSYSRAAEEMHVTQPTVSKQIKQLHEELELPLLEQLGKKIFLTEAGEELYKICSQWLLQWGQFEQRVADLKGLKKGKLRISAVTTTKFFMPRILGPFCAKYPGIDIALEVLNRDRLLERLDNNEDDLYIMGVPPDGLDVESQAFMDNPLVVLAPASHPMAGRNNIPFEELANEPFLVREQGSGTRMIVERIFKERQLDLNIKMELGSNEAIKQAVVGGLGLAMLSESTLYLDHGNKELALLDVEGFPLIRAWYVLRPKGKQVSVVAETFTNYLVNHIDLLVPRI